MQPFQSPGEDVVFRFVKLPGTADRFEIDRDFIQFEHQCLTMFLDPCVALSPQFVAFRFAGPDIQFEQSLRCRMISVQSVGFVSLSPTGVAALEMFGQTFRRPAP